MNLFQNYPNPFNPETTISFQFSNDPSMHQGRQNQPQLYNGTGKNEQTKLEIYNVKGQKVKTLVDEVLPTGEYSIIWDGKDDSGRHVSSGVYFYKLKTGNYEKTKRMVLMK